MAANWVLGSGTYAVGYYKNCFATGIGDTQITAYNGRVYPIAGPDNRGYYSFEIFVSADTGYFGVACYQDG